jgi:hypothetical protein
MTEYSKATTYLFTAVNVRERPSHDFRDLSKKICPATSLLFEQFAFSELSKNSPLTGLHNSTKYEHFLFLTG